MAELDGPAVADLGVAVMFRPNKCAAGFPIDHRPCKQCGSRPGEICHEHYRRLADAMPDLLLAAKEAAVVIAALLKAIDPAGCSAALRSSPAISHLMAAIAKAEG